MGHWPSLRLYRWLDTSLVTILLFGCVSPDCLTLTGDDWGVKGLSHH